VTVFRPQGSTSRVLAELARLWDQAAVHSPGQVTQKKLADDSGVPYTTVNGWATGAAAPRDLDQLVKVGSILAGLAKEPPSQRARGAARFSSPKARSTVIWVPKGCVPRVPPCSPASCSRDWQTRSWHMTLPGRCSSPRRPRTGHTHCRTTTRHGTAPSRTV
jgi:hypothetical protein